jgi:uncharacterized protein
MAEDGSKLTDVAVLADAESGVDLVISIAGMSRLIPLLSSSAGVAKAHIGFSRNRGHVVATVQASADLGVTCQRCLADFTLPVSGESQVALIGDEAEADKVPEDLESALAIEGRIRLRELVEEELLLALPAAPRHEQGECGETAAVAAEPAPVPTQRPFAALGELLGNVDKN